MIPSGGYAPFATVINTGVPATYSIELTSSKVISQDFANVQVENAQMFYDGVGNYFIAGELVNAESFPVHVENIAGAVLDDAGEVQAAAEAWAYGGYLLPAGDPSGLDRSPFSIKIFGPLRRYTGFAVYPLAVSGAPSEEIAYTASAAHTFMSNTDRFHVVGQVTSNTTTQIGVPEIMAALYDENGLVIDVYKLYAYPSLNPGETGFFDLYYGFNAINAMPELADRVKTVKVQINPESIYDVTHKNILGLQGVTRQYFDFGPSWYLTGLVVNTTGEPIGGGTVAAAVYDADGNLVGADFAYVNTTDPIPAGGTKKIDLYVTLDPDLDPATLTYDIIAWED